MNLIYYPKDVWFQISVVSRLFKDSFEKHGLRADLELTAGEARTLEYVSRSRETRQKFLAAAMSVEAMTLSSYIDRLMQLNLVIRCPDPIDRRANIISLSERGKDVHRRLGPVLDHISNNALKGLSLKQIRDFELIIDTIRANFDDNKQ